MSTLINEPKLMTICAEAVDQPDFPAEEFQALLDEIGAAANSTVKACMLAIALFTEAKAALTFKFSGARVTFRKDAVCRVFERYFED